jgi:hypothetical protein
MNQPSTSSMARIKDIPALREAIVSGHHEFIMRLGFGLRSSKTIALLRDGRFEVFNHHDGTLQKLTDEQLYSESNIGEAMTVGAFHLDRF